MEKFDLRKYKYLIAIISVFIIFILLVANAYKYLPKEDETNNLKNKQYIEIENNNTFDNDADKNETSNVEQEEQKERVDNSKTEGKFPNFFDEEELIINFDKTERFKELSDDELE